jgi:hypothetical protein
MQLPAMVEQWRITVGHPPAMVEQWRVAVVHPLVTPVVAVVVTPPATRAEDGKQHLGAGFVAQHREQGIPRHFFHTQANQPNLLNTVSLLISGKGAQP